jgi:hypothetical protein
MGPPLSERPPLPTEAERLAALEEKRAGKDTRKAANGRWLSEQRASQRKRAQKLAEKTAVRTAMDQWTREKFELMPKAKALAEAKIENRKQKQRMQSRAQAEKLANKAKMEKLQLAKLARLESNLERLQKTLQDPDVNPERKAIFEKRMPYLLTALEKCRTNLAFSNHIESSTKPSNLAVSNSPAVSITEPISLHLFLERVQERLAVGKARVSEIEKERNDVSYSPEDVAKKEEENIKVAITPSENVIAKENELIALLESKKKRLRTYLDTINGKERDYASKALKWQVLVEGLGMTVTEKASAVADLSKVTDVTFGSHVSKWSPAELTATRNARFEARRRFGETATGAETVSINTESDGQSNIPDTATGKEKAEESNKGVLGAWLKW